MAEEAPSGGIIQKWLKLVIGGFVGVLSGVVAMYSTAIVNKVVKPEPPVANFTVAAEGLTAHCQNPTQTHPTQWDFGDGTSLIPYDPAQPVVQHQYQKPGSYQVKLVIRNFLNEEHDRTVQVDVAPPAGTPQTLPPSVTELRVERIGNQSVAPAAFRIHGAVKNAEKILIDLGDKVEVLRETGNGAIDRLVVFDKPGTYPIQLIGQTGDTAVKQGQTVDVGKSAANAISVILRVTDRGVRTERRETPTTVSLQPVKGAKVVERSTVVRPSHLIVSATITKGDDKLVRNLKTEVAADKKSVKVTGEWIGPDPSTNPTAAHITMTLVEEKQRPVQFDPSTMSASFAQGMDTVSLTLPPQPLDAGTVKRTMDLELRQAGADGVTSSVFLTQPDMKMPWTKTLKGAGFSLVFTAIQNGNQVSIKMQQVRDP